MLTQFKESASFIQSKTSVQPTIGIILGTGLGGLVKEIQVIDEIVSTVYRFCNSSNNGLKLAMPVTKRTLFKSGFIGFPKGIKLP